MVNTHSSMPRTHASTAVPSKRLSVSPAGDYRERNQAAYRAAKRLKDDGAINAGAQETFNLLVKKCRAGTYTTITEPELASERKVARRTIQIHLRRLVDTGLIRIEPAGINRRKYITAFEPKDDLTDDPTHDPPAEMQPENDPDVLLELAAQECVAGNLERGQALAFQAAMIKAGRPFDLGRTDAPQGSFFGADLNDPNFVPLTKFGSSSTIKESLSGDLTGAMPPNPPTGGGDPFRPRRKEIFGREEPKRLETEAAKILRAVGVSEPAIRELGHLDAGYVRQQLEAARSCGRARDVPAFLVGALRTGGVYGSSWGNGGKQAPRAAPTLDEWQEELSQNDVVIVGGCLRCGAALRGSDRGVCPYCSSQGEPARGGGT